MCKHFLCTCCSLFFLAVAIGQSGPIDADRPDQTEGVNNVPKNYLQFEFGFSRQKNQQNDYQYEVPDVLSKYGLSNRVELRLITTILNSALPIRAVNKTGLEPVVVGTRISLWEERKALPKTSFLFHVAIPGMSSSANNIHFAAPDFKLAMQNTIAKNCRWLQCWSGMGWGR